MGIQFGTDGWRAIIGETYTYENVAKVLQAFCDLNRQSSNKQVLLGYDRRFCGRAFAEEAARVLAGNGFRVLLSQKFCPTPCISWMTKHQGALAGVVITASHNPFQWNGVKFKESYGGSASPEYTSHIELQIQQNDQAGRQMQRLSLEEAEKQGLLKFFDPHRDYVKQLARMVNLQAIRRAKLRVVVDPLYGAGSGFFSALLGSGVTEIRGEDNPGFGGINPEPIEKNLQLAMQTVKKQRAQIGLATDGDADRIGAVDEKGNFVDSHQIFSLILRHLLTVKKWKGDVIKTVSTTQMIQRLGDKYGAKVVETPIGFKYICQEFLKTTPLMGGEESGGIGIARHVYERDGILSGLFLLEILAHHKKPLSKILADLQKEVGPLYFRREDVHLPVEKISLLKKAMDRGERPVFSKLKVSSESFRDGFKFQFTDDSWLLIRPSGTEPLLRIYGEAPSAAKSKQLVEMGKKFVAGL